MTVILISQSMCLMQFIIIYKKKYKNSVFFDIFTSFHLKSPQSLHSQNLSRVRN